MSTGYGWEGKAGMCDTANWCAPCSLPERLCGGNKCSPFFCATVGIWPQNL